jgi:hypothetical protein
MKPVVATGGNRSQIAAARKRPNHLKPLSWVATGCRLERRIKEGVDVSSPSRASESFRGASTRRVLRPYDSNAVVDPARSTASASSKETARRYPKVLQERFRHERGERHGWSFELRKTRSRLHMQGGRSSSRERARGER